MGCLHSVFRCLGLRKTPPNTPVLPTSNDPRAMDWRSPAAQQNYDAYFKVSVLGERPKSNPPAPETPYRAPPSPYHSSPRKKILRGSSGSLDNSRWAQAEMDRRFAARIPPPDSFELTTMSRPLSVASASGQTTSDAASFNYPDEAQRAFYQSREADSVKSSVTDLGRNGTAKEHRNREILGVHHVPETEDEKRAREKEVGRGITSMEVELGAGTWERAPDLGRDSIDGLEDVDLS